MNYHSKLLYKITQNSQTINFPKQFSFVKIFLLVLPCLLIRFFHQLFITFSRKIPIVIIEQHGTYYSKSRGYSTQCLGELELYSIKKEIILLFFNMTKLWYHYTMVDDKQIWKEG